MIDINAVCNHTTGRLCVMSPAGADVEWRACRSTASRTRPDADDSTGISAVRSRRTPPPVRTEQVRSRVLAGTELVANTSSAQPTCSPVVWGSSRV